MIEQTVANYYQIPQKEPQKEPLNQTSNIQQATGIHKGLRITSNDQPVQLPTTENTETSNNVLSRPLPLKDRDVSQTDRSFLANKAIVCNQLAACVVGTVGSAMVRGVKLLDPSNLAITALHQGGNFISATCPKDSTWAKCTQYTTKAVCAADVALRTLTASNLASGLAIIGIKGIQYLGHSMAQQQISDLFTKLPSTVTPYAEPWAQAGSQIILSATLPDHTRTADGSDHFSGFGAEAIIGPDVTIISGPGMGSVTVNAAEITELPTAASGQLAVENAYYNRQFDNGVGTSIIKEQVCVTAGEMVKCFESGDRVSIQPALPARSVVPVDDGLVIEPANGLLSGNALGSIATAIDRSLTFPVAQGAPVTVPASHPSSPYHPAAYNYFLSDKETLYSFLRWPSHHLEDTCSFSAKLLMNGDVLPPHLQPPPGQPAVEYPVLSQGHGRGWAFVSDNLPPFRYEVMFANKHSNSDPAAVEQVEQNGFFRNPFILSLTYQGEGFLYPDLGIIHMVTDLLGDMKQINSRKELTAISHQIRQKLAAIDGGSMNYSLESIDIVKKYNPKVKHQNPSLELLPKSDALIIISPYILSPLQNEEYFADKPESSWLLSINAQSRTLNLIYAEKGLALNSAKASYVQATLFLAEQFNDVDAFYSPEEIARATPVIKEDPSDCRCTCSTPESPRQSLYKLKASTPMPATNVPAAPIKTESAQSPLGQMATMTDGESSTALPDRYNLLQKQALGLLQRNHGLKRTLNNLISDMDKQADKINKRRNRQKELDLEIDRLIEKENHKLEDMTALMLQDCETILNNTRAQQPSTTNKNSTSDFLRPDHEHHLQSKVTLSPARANGDSPLDIPDDPEQFLEFIQGQDESQLKAFIQISNTLNHELKKEKRFYKTRNEYLKRRIQHPYRVETDDLRQVKQKSAQNIKDINKEINLMKNAKLDECTNG